MLPKAVHSLLAFEGAKGPTGNQPTALVYDEMSKYHVTGINRPECPQRYNALLDSLGKCSYFSALRPFQARPATDDEILACHTNAYLARPGGKSSRGSPNSARETRMYAAIRSKRLITLAGLLAWA